MHSNRSTALSIAASLVLATGAASFATASPPSNVTPLLLARATFDEFKVMSNPDNGQLFKAEAKGPIDVVVRQHTYLAGGSTGWHAHPYPVLITVKEGTLTFYDANDPTCTPQVVTAGQGYVDSGRGHLVRNESGQTAVDVSVIMAPVGAAFRSELVAPNPYCGF
jgi:quercetin dioxygenase-like cupin family protein